MTNPEVSTLEKQIRDKASQDAGLIFDGIWNRLVGGSSDVWWKLGREDQQSLEALRKRIKDIKKGNAADDAVKTFIATYRQLVEQFPTLVEEAADEAGSGS